ncbi:FdrA family protein [Gordonibacter sp. An230]|uniref:acyl-CoA synthetase FdrA n=1 Tax=Gordonibacter sp. An230 TaxID=1965592 RepID=UPI000B38F290|nr:acyl-CoA synthetase FdrA [Gordonibacter sp. An230]OUO91274.1 FdrA family protein [Gordonibacter sp. An230]
MHQVTVVRRNSYFDSVTLMSIGSEIKGREGVEEAVVSMATELNKEILLNVGLATEETDAAGPNDFVVAVRAASKEACDAAVEAVDERLTRKDKGAGEREVVCRTVRQAAAEGFGDVAVLSVPGRYAAREAMLAMRQGLHVMMFSDNVSIEDERRLKEYAAAHGLLMMGPDCGTAAINGVGLCFANKVRPGRIGLVAASGTGLQEVMVQIDRMGGGVSQAIGTGGRDLKEAVGGIMMLEGVKALAADEGTDVIVLVSKPPAESVSARILGLLEMLGKPAVVCFLEGDASIAVPSHVHVRDNLFDAAVAAVALSRGEEVPEAGSTELDETMRAAAAEAHAKLRASQRNLRAFFCGGTLCAEAVFLLRSRLDALRSNVSHRPGEEMGGSEARVGNVLLDMGDDEFTNGRPHPMIEPALRNDIIVEQGSDPTVGVVLLDFELGFGSHDDPVGQTLPAIRAARAAAAEGGRELAFVGYVCATEGDKQGLAAQTALLEQEGVIVARSNREAALLAASIL